MRVRTALMLFAIMLAIASAAAVEIIAPNSFSAQNPIVSAPGNPGGFLTKVYTTCNGPLIITDIKIAKPSHIIVTSKHISLDNLSSSFEFAAPVREVVVLNYTLKDTRSNGDSSVIYATISKPAGMEVSIEKTSTTTIYHLSPTVWVIENNNGPNSTFYVNMSLYGQPIGGTNRIISATFTLM